MLADFSPTTREVLFDHVEGKRVVSCRYRRVGREPCRAPHFLERLVEGRAVFDQFTNALQRDKRGMALVEMPHGGFEAKRANDPDPSHAEDDLLLQAGLAIAAIEPGGQFAVPRRVLSE